MPSINAETWFNERGLKLGRVADPQTKVLLMNAYDEIIANGSVDDEPDTPEPSTPAEPETSVEPETSGPEPVAEGGGE